MLESEHLQLKQTPVLVEGHGHIQFGAISVKYGRGWHGTLETEWRSGVTVKMETYRQVLAPDLFRSGSFQICEQITPLGLVEPLREPAYDVRLSCG